MQKLKKMKKDKLVKLLPLLTLALATIILLFTTMITDIVQVKEHLVGLVFLAIVIGIQAFNTKMGYQATGVVLLISTFAFAGYTSTIFFVRIGIITIDLFCLLILLIYLVIHRNQVLDWILDLIYGSTPSKKA
jgi:hypothetical protein